MTSTVSQRRWQIIQADCLTALPKLAPASIDTVITDPPYGINIAGMKWDISRQLDPTRPAGRRRSRTNPGVAFRAFCARWAAECIRVMKPGAHLTAFAAPRTAHLMACGIEDAGLEIRDTLMWLKGNGYPASRQMPGGRGTGLKPAYEPIILARKPLDGTLDHNLAVHSTGALNIDACRIQDLSQPCLDQGHQRKPYSARSEGRWPANLLLSHHPQCSPVRCLRGCPASALGSNHRFFYCAKANPRERNAGCQQLPRRVTQTYKVGALSEQQARANPVRNDHPTVKPLDLMRWLVRLTIPQGGTVLDPFTGSGSTGAAVILEGGRFVGIEREANYVPIARARIKHWNNSRTAHPARARTRA